VRGRVRVRVCASLFIYVRRSLFTYVCRSLFTYVRRSLFIYVRRSLVSRDSTDKSPSEQYMCINTHT